MAAPAPHLVQALGRAHELAAERDGLPGWRALEAQAERVLARLPAPAEDPDFIDAAETEGPNGGPVDPDVADRTVGSLTALEEAPDEEHLELALGALTDLEDALPDAPGPGSHPGR